MGAKIEGGGVTARQRRAHMGLVISDPIGDYIMCGTYRSSVVAIVLPPTIQ